MIVKIKFYILLFIPITIVISSFFINDTTNMKGRYLSPLESLHELTYEKNITEGIKISKKEEKWLKKTFRKKDSIIINIDDNRGSKIINSLVNKGILTLKPSSFHILGTDNLGRDLFQMLILATRNNLILSLIAVILSITMGTIIGILQGYVLNRDTARYFQIIRSGIRFLVRSITSIPMLVWLLIIVLFNEIILDVQDDLIKSVWTFGLMGFFYYSSILSEAIEEHILSIKDLEFLSASELMGLSKWKIIIHHIIRTNLGIVLFSQSLMVIVQTIMLEITISFSYINFGLSNVVSYGTLVSQMFKNSGSMNMIIPIIFAGFICSILNWLIKTFKEARV